MLTSKFNLYDTEWTDRVFDDRNKAYGAYELRHSYSNTMVKAMAITFLGVGVLFGSTLVFKTSPAVQPLPTNDTTIVKIDPNVKPPEAVHPPKPIEPVTPPKVSEPVKTTAFVPPVVRPDAEAAKQPVINATLTNTLIGPVTSDGGDIKHGPPAIEPGPSVTPAPEIVYNVNTVDFMPEPVGGATAWNKFLSKNLRFPAVAQEEGVGGKVYLSFIIEKDGSLSNITVDKAAGHGFDEEALRVLKLAKAWKPGMQNGQPVRVKYSIPITFQAPEI
ncbi:energy transducer TonB [Mucilaginibacter flavidus]|uniref:energy transducer TonB n=1 Tax=Mucilaginibacter flavidus TaxID=2949309 RepID=UPI002092E8B6|nr:energy transducer TonB [Mucilaginibacter flavidus]MCO5948160.1 TonB family protein [Mucilaginibacter flavidus]